MSRYIGPRLRVQRRLGTRLPGLTRKEADRRPYPPGEHGPARTWRRRQSEYGLRLAEKQKIRFHYGLTERQLRNAVARAARRRGPTGELLLRALESRLDNVVFRLGFAPTVVAARQLVGHGHVLVNDRAVDFPAVELRPGDVVAVHPRSRQHPLVIEGAASGPVLGLPSYLERAPDGMSGRVIAPPERRDVPLAVEDKLVVEYYAR